MGARRRHAVGRGAGGAGRRARRVRPSPLDALDEADARWLRACVWPGQGDREARLAQAIEGIRRSQDGPGAPEVRIARAGEVPGLLPRGEDGLVYQTIVRDYLPGAEWRRYRSGMRRWLEARPPASAMWVELEVTGEARGGGPPARITAHARGAAGPGSFVLARCEPHPRRVAVDEGQVVGLVEVLAGER